MGQPVAVVRSRSSRPGLVRFEANRTLTGMGHERYRSVGEASGDRWSAILARRLLETGQVDSVHVHGNVVTVDLNKGFDGEGLDEVVEDLYTYYREGFVPPPLEMPAEEAPAGSGAAAASGGDDVDAAAAAAAAKVPAHLLDRSRDAKERWKAKQAG